MLASPITVGFFYIPQQANFQAIDIKSIIVLAQILLRVDGRVRLAQPNQRIIQRISQ